MPSILTAQDLNKWYQTPQGGVFAVRDVNLRVTPGDFVGIFGPSGSGKTTLISLLSGLTRPTSGSVELDGHVLTGLTPTGLADLRRFSMGFVFQHFYLLQHLTALENVLLPMGFRTDLSPSGQLTRARELLTLVGLEKRLDHFPPQLSGGEQQRVAIARAIANEPKVVFADEPTGNLDRRSARVVLELFRDLNNRLNQTFVVVTHDPSFEDYCSRLIRMDDGAVVFDSASSRV